MSFYVSRQAHFLGQTSRFHIGKPFTPGIAIGFGERVAHLLGHHLPVVHEQIFSTASPGAAFTYRFKHRSSANARAIAILAVAQSVDSFGGASGTLDVPGAETATPLSWRQPVGGVTDLGDLVSSDLRFVKVCTSDTLQEHTYAVSNLILHSIVVYEVPLGILEGNHIHLDRTFSSGRRYITDDVTYPDPRGVPQLLACILKARRDMRRHLVSEYWTGTTTGGATTYITGSATAGDGLTVFARKVMGSGVTLMPARAQVYVSAMTAANTFTFTFDFDGTTYTTAGIAAASVPGWFTADPGLVVNVPISASGSVLKITATRTAGAGTCTVTGVSVIEDVPP